MVYRHRIYARIVFLIPAFFEGKYTLRDIVTKGDFSDRFVPVQKFFYTPWNYGGGNELSKELGIAQWFMVFASIVVFFRTKKEGNTMDCGSIASFTGSINISHDQLVIRNLATDNYVAEISVSVEIIDPCRIFFICLGGAVIASFSKSSKKIACGVVVFVSLASTFFMWHAQAYSIKPESFYTGIYNGTTDTGESSPIWSVRFMEKRSDAPMQVIEGTASIKQVSRSSTRHFYQIVASQSAKLVENTLYFPGWEVRVDGKSVGVEFQDPAWRGLMTFWVPTGEHQIEVHFKETKLRKMANALSIVGLLLFIL